MKFNGLKFLQISAVAIIVILVVIKSEFFKIYGDDDSYPHGKIIDTEVKPPMHKLNTEIAVGQATLDSLIRVRERQISEFTYKGTFNAYLGILQPSDPIHPFAKFEQDYLQFSSVGLAIERDPISNNYLQYFLQNNTPFLSKVIYRKDGRRFERRSFVLEQVPFYYNTASNAILLPISHTVKIIIYLISILLMLVALYMFLFMIINFFYLLFNISRNNAFNSANMFIFKKIIMCGLILSLGPLTVQYLIYYFLKLKFSSVKLVLTYDFWNTDFYLLLISLFLSLFYSAFRSAYEMKLESDLII